MDFKDSGFPVEANTSVRESALKDLWRTFSVHVVRDYLLLSYRATVPDQKVREQRGIKTGAFSMPHIASPEVVVDEENRRLILYSRIDMSSENWDDWRATEGVEVLRPELPWEGSELPLLPSLRGEIDVATRELRDPYLLRDGDERGYLYFVGSGEKAIGVALLTSP